MSVVEMEKEELKMRPFANQSPDAELQPMCSECGKSLEYVKIVPDPAETTDDLEEL